MKIYNTLAHTFSTGVKFSPRGILSFQGLNCDHSKLSDERAIFYDFTFIQDLYYHQYFKFTFYF